MKCKVTLATAALLLAANSWADQVPYYSLEEISVAAEGASYGPFPSALSDDGEFMAANSLKANLVSIIDIGLPFSFNRECQWADEICDLQFYGSETEGQLSYQNAYKAWRNAMSNAASNGYTSYFMANTLVSGSDQVQAPYAPNNSSSDVSVHDISNSLPSQSGIELVVGHASAPYIDNEREFVRRAFIKENLAEGIALLPDFLTYGGFSSAYKVQDVTYENGVSKTLVVGGASVSFPRDEDDYFQDCYFSNEDSQISTLNDLVNCPGFDTQAWAWDVTNAINVETELSGYALATEWLDDNEDNENSRATYSGSALDINTSGIAVGMSTFERHDDNEGARARAVIMMPDTEGNYSKPTEITQVYDDLDDDSDHAKDSLYNTWAEAITNNNIVIGNREYSSSKAVNRPVEFFVFDLNSSTSKTPLLDKKVLTTKQRLDGVSPDKRGANSFAYDINEAGLIVGEADDYDQIAPVRDGVPRSQSAFLYDKNLNSSWFINDLLCTEQDGVVTSPLVRIRSARVINDDGIILAEGFKYSSASDYKNKNNAVQVAYKLTPTAGMTPDQSPNCWESDLLDDAEDKHSRSGAASVWMWLLALPLLLVRRFYK